jgi:hypothetical protein
VPADRFFAAAPEVLATLQARVADNALQLARTGMPRKSFYLTGRVGEQSISLHAEGSRVILTREDGSREQVDLAAPGPRAVPGQRADLPDPVAVEGRLMPGVADHEEAATAPGASVLDEIVSDMSPMGLGPQTPGGEK